MTVKVAQLESIFKKMWKEDWEYNWGSHKEGSVDCSGAFVYAFNQYGIKYPNGSNTIARKYTVGGLIPVKTAKIIPGMAAFKVRKPGEKYYDLPKKYQKDGANYDGDLNDYYHIGLVDYDTAYVLNAQGTKNDFERNLISTWDYVALLKYVDYDSKINEVNPMTYYVKGGTLNLRAAASTTSFRVAQIPDGAAVTVLDQSQPDWWFVQYDGKSGYVKREYLEERTSDSSVITISKDQALAFYQTLKAALNL